MDQILPYLYLSSIDESMDPNLLKKNRIKHILFIADSYKPPYIMDYYQQNGIKHHHIYLPDIPSAQIHKYFSETTQWIHRNQKRREATLIHCMAGISRSASIILAYLLYLAHYSKHKGLLKTPEPTLLPNVLGYLRSRRSIVNPNPGFIQQLFKYEKSNFTPRPHQSPVFVAYDS